MSRLSRLTINKAGKAPTGRSETKPIEKERSPSSLAALSTTRLPKAGPSSSEGQRDWSGPREGPGAARRPASAWGRSTVCARTRGCFLGADNGCVCLPVYLGHGLYFTFHHVLAGGPGDGRWSRLGTWADALGLEGATFCLFLSPYIHPVLGAVALSPYRRISST